MGCRSAAAAGMLLLALAMARTGHATIDSTDIDWGVKLIKPRDFRTTTNAFSSPFGEKCKTSAGCGRICTQSCLTAELDASCVKACGSRCSAVECDHSLPLPDGSKNCVHHCHGSCVAECRQSKLVAMDRKYKSCLDDKERYCVKKCRKKQASEKDCAALCSSPTAAQSFEAYCIRQQTQNCMNSCGQHICIDGTCQCPIMSEGDRQCTRHAELARNAAPKGEKFCYQSFFSEKFLQQSDGTWSRPPAISGSLTASATRISTDTLALAINFAATAGTYTHPAPDIRDLAEWRTCAVVGSSHDLLGGGWGKEIDTHTAVIRFNDAPTRGYETDVGSKTTLRVQNNKYCGYCESASELLFPYTQVSLKDKCYPRDGLASCKVVRSSRVVSNFVERFYEDHPNFATLQELLEQGTALSGRQLLEQEEGEEDQDYDEEPSGSRRIKKTSAGLLGTIMAMHLCGKVDLYGFAQSDQHYYPKVLRTDRDWSTFHLWDLENKCIASYANVVPGVTNRMHRDSTANALDAVMRESLNMV
mmetsp:Transcript_1694/g.4132  ORF Transcript_1694/g.4132 Transcript_1694/m.4132 type:complete len:531 (-) Transcript_1694:87-1679(-)